MSDQALEVLFPTGKEVTVQNTTIVIKPFKFGELSKVFKVIDPIIDPLFTALNTSTNQIQLISKIIVDSSESVMDLISISTKQPRDWIDSLEMDEGLQLFTTILEVNSDFFVHKVLPLLNSSLAKVVQVPPVTTGLTS